jgi:16S rRNA (cytidine1402-2'-O)-methyltransferase
MCPPSRRTLYVVATPIGNLKDITLRALEVLHEVDLVASESVTKTRNLLRSHGLRVRVVSYRESNCRKMIPRLVARMCEGGTVALVSEAGTPGVSDPGRRLVARARAGGVRVVPVPGASSLTAALSVAGMDEERFVFEGFLPRRDSRRMDRLRALAGEERLLVFFEAPHRMRRCLADMLEVFGDRECMVGREMTKLHEEIAAGRLSELARRFEETEARGESVIVCAGRPAAEKKEGLPAASIDLAAAVGILEAQGLKKKEIAKLLAPHLGLPGSEVYRLIVDRLS